MAKLTKEYVAEKNLQFMTIKKFINQYHPGLTLPAINYAIDKDKVDYIKPGRERFIVITDNSLKYNPIHHPSRSHNSTMSL